MLFDPPFDGSQFKGEIRSIPVTVVEPVHEIQKYLVPGSTGRRRISSGNILAGSVLQKNVVAGIFVFGRKMISSHGGKGFLKNWIKRVGMPAALCIKKMSV